MISDLPPEEKTVDRLSEEGFILILAGGDVSASNLAMLSYHLLANPDTLAKLTSELREAIPELDGWPKWQQLENLPYLVCVFFLSSFFIRALSSYINLLLSFSTITAPLQLGVWVC